MLVSLTNYHSVTDEKILFGKHCMLVSLTDCCRQVRGRLLQLPCLRASDEPPPQPGGGLFFGGGGCVM